MFNIEIGLSYINLTKRHETLNATLTYLFALIKPLDHNYLRQIVTKFNQLVTFKM